MTGGDRQSALVNADSFWFTYTLSSIAAIIAETVTYPLDLTKTRLQIQGEKHVGGHNVAGQKRGMVKTIVGIGSEEGAIKLFQGLTPALYRHLLYTGCRISFYEIIREKILKKNSDGSFPVWKSSLGGLTAGAMGQFIASPTDLVKVQMQMEGRRRLEGKPPRVKSTTQAFRKIITEEGFRGLYRGVVPNVQRAALINMGDLATYDTVKHGVLQYTSLTDNWVTHTISGTCSGLSMAILGTPADVIKTRIMNQPTENGRGKLYSGSVDCLVKTVNQEGFLALYKGFLPIWGRLGPWSLIFWISFEQIRKLCGVSSF
ncbi:mitochondrial uncoupling protein 4-like [Mytilus edulis]